MMKTEDVVQKGIDRVDRAHLSHSKRQKIVQEAEGHHGAEVQELRLLGRAELEMLRLVADRGSISTSSLACTLMLPPARVAQGVERLSRAALIVERPIERHMLVEPTAKCKRLKRAIAAME